MLAPAVVFDIETGPFTVLMSTPTLDSVVRNFLAHTPR